MGTHDHQAHPGQCIAEEVSVSQSFRDLPPVSKVLAVIALAILIVIAVAMLAMLGKWGYHAYLWLWHRA